METLFLGMIMGFREGLEAFLIIAIMIQYLTKIKKKEYKKNVWMGVFAGVAVSMLIGLALKLLGFAIQNAERFAKIWESGASFIALVLVTTFIIWMIRHGSNMVSNIKNQVDANLSPLGIFLVAFMMVTREGAEVAIFTFAGKYSFLSIAIGIAVSVLLTILIFYSLVRVNLKIIFNITLAYLILQAGFLLGYSIHEGLSALKDLGYIASDNIVYLKAFDFSGTVIDHKAGIIGLPAYVLLGWYSKPEWIQFIVQYAYSILIFAYWKFYKEKSQV